jgi:hypothetical protein
MTYYRVGSTRLILRPASVPDDIVPIPNGFDVLSTGQDGLVGGIGRTSAEDHRVDFEDLSTGICIWPTAASFFGSDMSMVSVVQTGENCKEIDEAWGQRAD